MAYPLEDNHDAMASVKKSVGNAVKARLKKKMAMGFGKASGKGKMEAGVAGKSSVANKKGY